MGWFTKIVCIYNSSLNYGSVNNSTQYYLTPIKNIIKNKYKLNVILDS